MFVAQVPLRSKGLGRGMQEMRLWLDSWSYEASSFTFDTSRDRITVQVGFRHRMEAIAFAERFAGSFTSN